MGEQTLGPVTLGMRGMRGWLHRGVERPLLAAVGGPARLRAIVLLACVLGLNSADTATIGATAVQLKSALHIGNTELGLLATVSTAVGAVATLPVGVLTDRFDRTRLLTFAIIMWSAAMVVSGFSGSYLMLLITRLALSAVVATAGPAVASLTGDLFPASERGRVYGFILTGELIGAGIGFLVSGGVAGLLSWRFAFWVLAIPGLILSVAIWRLLPEPARGGQSRLQIGDTTFRSEGDVDQRPVDEQEKPDPAAGAGEESQVARELRRQRIRPRADAVLQEDPSNCSLWWAVRYVLSVRTNVVLIVATGLGYFFFAGLRTFAVVFLRGRFDLGQGTASTLLVVLGSGAVIGVLTTGRLSDWLLGRHHITARPIVGGFSVLLAVVLFVPALLTTTFLIAAPLIFIAAMGIGGANPPLDAARLDLIHSRLWGRAESVRTVLRASFEASAPLLFGYVSTLFGGHDTGLARPEGSASHHAIGLDYTFLIMLIPLLVAVLLVLLYGRRTYPQDVATAIASERAHDD